MGHTHDHSPRGFSKGSAYPTPELKKHRPTASGANYTTIADVLMATGAKCVTRWEGKHKVWFFPDLMILIDARNAVRHLKVVDGAPIEYRWWFRESKTAYYPIASWTAKALDEMLQQVLDEVILGEKT